MATGTGECSTGSGRCHARPLSSPSSPIQWRIRHPPIRCLRPRIAQADPNSTLILLTSRIKAEEGEATFPNRGSCSPRQLHMRALWMSTVDLISAEGSLQWCVWGGDCFPGELRSPHPWGGFHQGNLLQGNDSPPEFILTPGTRGYPLPGTDAIVQV